MLTIVQLREPSKNFAYNLLTIAVFFKAFSYITQL